MSSIRQEPTSIHQEPTSIHQEPTSIVAQNGRKFRIKQTATPTKPELPIIRRKQWGREEVRTTSELTIDDILELRPRSKTCSKRNNIKPPPLPQLSSEQRPEKWDVRTLENGNFQCMWCDHSHSIRRYVQQHMKKHFPTEYNCVHCGDKFHLKTMWENHFIEHCSICNKMIKGNIKSHQNRCKNPVYNCYTSK
jgi:hypothetical protein